MRFFARAEPRLACRGSAVKAVTLTTGGKRELHRAPSLTESQESPRAGFYPRRDPPRDDVGAGRPKASIRRPAFGAVTVATPPVGRQAAVLKERDKAHRSVISLDGVWGGTAASS